MFINNVEMQDNAGNIYNPNTNADIVKYGDSTVGAALSDLTFEVAKGTATVITLTITMLIDGYTKTFIASANNNGSGTTINGKALYKPNTTTTPNLIKGKAYTVWYNSTSNCFFIKASAEGNTVASHVLAGDTFSNDNDTGLKGTLDLTNLVTGNIKSGVTINGVTGKSTVVDTVDAILDPQYLLTGYSGYDDGVKKAGTLPIIANNTAPSNISYWAPGTYGNTYAKAHFQVPRGYYDGNIWISQDVPQLLPDNVINGKNIFGVAGAATLSSLGGKHYASGSVIGNDMTGVIVTFDFQPRMAYIYGANGGWMMFSGMDRTRTLNGGQGSGGHGVELRTNSIWIGNLNRGTIGYEVWE